MGMTVDGIIVDIFLIVILIGNALIGYRKGLVKIVFNLFSSIIAIIFVLIFCKPTTNFVINHTEFANNIENSISEKVSAVFSSGNSQFDLQSGENRDFSNIIKIFVGDELGTILQNSNDNIVQTITYKITYKIVSVIVFLGLFVVAKVLVFILKTYMEWITELPFLDLIDEAGGMVYGVISGIFFLYMVLAIISLLMPIYGESAVVKAIQESIIGSRMFNHNIILGLIFKIF